MNSPNNWPFLLFPDALREPPEDGAEVWLADPTVYEPISFEWTGDAQDIYWLDCRLLHRTEEGALEHMRAIIMHSGGVTK